MGSADHPNPWKGIFIMSYDPKSGRWVRSGVDNAGERNAASSTGWKDNTWVWKNDAVNIVVKQQSKNARTFAIDVEGDGASNEWPKPAASAPRIVVAHRGVGVVSGSLGAG
jgi:hypothetical protein